MAHANDQVATSGTCAPQSLTEAPAQPVTGARAAAAPKASESGLNARQMISDLVALIKPSITLMTLIMATGGLLLSRQEVSLWLVLATLLGTGLAVGSANTLNMVLERKTDALMKRTKRRPLPAGRLPVSIAIAFGVVLGVLAMVLLATLVNPMTALLGGVALISYVFIYTPLKYRSPLALAVGAIPGAMPPLMGWTAATGTIEAPGLVLFGILALWQLPHFLAISIYSRHDYERAGIKTVPSIRGIGVAKLQSMAYATLLVPVSLSLLPLGVAGWIYGAAALGLGTWFWVVGARGWRAPSNTQWARKFFLASLVYLPALVLALALDAVIAL